jgi:signal transduction histidine kinase
VQPLPPARRSFAVRLPAAARGIGLRIALATVAVAALAVTVLAVGVLIVGGETFAALMKEHGESTDAARAMFDQSVSTVVIVALVVAVLAAVGLAALMGHRLSRPLRVIGGAARRIAGGDYAARVPRDGPEEAVSLADSFNQMAAALEEQERIRRDFITNAAHELRTPLTNLTGYLEALRDGVIPAERPTFESLLEETERLVRLSSSLDTLAEGDASTAPPAMTDLDVAAAVRAAADLAAPIAARAGLELAVEVPEVLRGRAEPDHLAQVLGNLLQNAVRYTPAGQRVTLRGEQRPGTILISVINTGSTIPPEDLGRVFERFYRVEKSRDRAHGGAGIGLAIVRQLVEAMGGQVGADSGEGRTRFWFTLRA